MQRQVADNRPAISISKAYVVKINAALAAFAALGIRCILNIRCFHKQLIKALKACHTTLVHLAKAQKLHQRLHKQTNIQEERHQLAKGHHPLVDQNTAYD